MSDFGRQPPLAVMSAERRQRPVELEDYFDAECVGGLVTALLAFGAGAAEKHSPVKDWRDAAAQLSEALRMQRVVETGARGRRSTSLPVSPPLPPPQLPPQPPPQPPQPLPQSQPLFTLMELEAFRPVDSLGRGLLPRSPRQERLAPNRGDVPPTTVAIATELASAPPPRPPPQPQLPQPQMFADFDAILCQVRLARREGVASDRPSVEALRRRVLSAFDGPELLSDGAPGDAVRLRRRCEALRADIGRLRVAEERRRALRVASRQDAQHRLHTTVDSSTMQRSGLGSGGAFVTFVDDET